MCIRLPIYPNYTLYSFLIPIVASGALHNNIVLKMDTSKVLENTSR